MLTQISGTEQFDWFNSKSNHEYSWFDKIATWREQSHGHVACRACQPPDARSAVSRRQCGIQISHEICIYIELFLKTSWRARCRPRFRPRWVSCERGCYSLKSDSRAFVHHSNLQSNRFSGTIPSQFGRMTKLRFTCEGAALCSYLFEFALLQVIGGEQFHGYAPD